jgi:hypothetical protein
MLYIGKNGIVIITVLSKASRHAASSNHTIFGKEIEGQKLENVGMYHK